MGHYRLVLSLIPPFLALGLQLWLWGNIRPDAWLLFYPAVFCSAWLGGLRGGVAATLLSLGLAGGFFAEPAPSLVAETDGGLTAMAVFAFMGFLFAGFHERYQAQVKGQAQLLRDLGLSERRFRTMFEEAPLGIALTDSQTRNIVEVNPRFAEIVGRSRSDLKSIDWKDITESEDARKDMDNMARLNAGDIAGFRMNKRFLRPDGAEVWVSMTVAPLQAGSEESPKHLCMVEDITDREALEREIRTSLQRLNLVNTAAGIGVWDWDLVDGALAWDDTMVELYDVSPEEQQQGLSYETWRSRIHPADLELAEAHLQDTIRQQTSYDHTFRILRRDGSLRWIHSASVIERDATGQSRRMIGINQDVTLLHEHQEALTQARAEAAHQASERRLGALIAQGLAGIAETDAAGRLIKVNDRYCEIVGHPRQALLGKPLSDITYPHGGFLTPPYLDEFIRSGQPLVFEQRYRALDGSLRWANLSITRVPDAHGEADHFLALVVDIDASKQSEERLRLALSASHIGMFDWDLRSGKITWSPEHEQLWGFQPGEFDGSYEGFARRVHPDDLKVTQERLDSARDTHQPYRHDYRVIWPDGSIHWITGRGEFEYDESGQALRMRGTVIDVTHRIRAEEELREQQERLSEAQRIARIGSWIHELDGRVTWSQETYHLLGVNPRVFTPQEEAFLALLHPDDSPRVSEWFRQHRAGQRPAALMMRRDWPDGSLHYLRGQGELQYDNQRQPLRIVGTVQDVTEQYLAEEQLRKSQEQLALSLEAGQFGAWQWDLTDTRFHLTPTFRQIFGLADTPDYHYAQLIDRIHPEDRPRIEADIQQAIATGERYAHEYRLLLSDGTERWVASFGHIRQSAEGQSRFLHGVIQDITVQKQAERLRQTEERLRLATEGGQIGTWYWDIARDSVDASDLCRQHVALPEGIAFTYAYLISVLHSEDRDRIEHAVHTALREHRNYATEYRVAQADGSYRWIAAKGLGVYNETGAAEGMLGITLDITERRAMEDEILALNADLEIKVEERTRQLAAANAAKSQFLASMSHEIRTPMNAVLGLAQLLEDEPLTEDQLQMVHRINTAGRSLLSIINDILDFSKIEAGQLSVEQRPFKLTELLSHIDNLMGPAAQSKGLTLRLQDDASIAGRLSGDALRIEQVLINLVGNALKFTEQGGVTIRVAPVTVTESSARLRFDIQDTGIGMSPDAVTRLFQPFTQADSGIARRFGGTGLGLSISKRLVELMGGEIGVTSTPYVGSTFWFELPFDRLADEEKPASSSPEVKGPRLRGLRLLVVDDSQINLYLAERVLKREGAEVTMMKDGQQALDALRANPQGYDLVLMDIQMPVMDGLTATRAIREELGLVKLPVIALTAGVMAGEKQNALDAGVNDFLPKPMDLDLMATMIRSYCTAEASV